MRQSEQFPVAQANEGERFSFVQSPLKGLIHLGGRFEPHQKRRQRLKTRTDHVIQSQLGKDHIAGKLKAHPGFAAVKQTRTVSLVIGFRPGRLQALLLGRQRSHARREPGGNTAMRSRRRIR
ncbi:hypothetical protein FRY98_24220 [Paenibacillus faecis]|uniref:Uncharacterized protein n=1 Tax=Paenibacillus faecis TaxID=862114 RepID=A0A5D0CLY9_9BACL|nr:hypothetical protein FRY98_24220 [Paenibacillus faecis]